MVAYLTRPRQKYENGGPVIPEPKPEEAIHAGKLKDFEAKVNLGVQGIRGGMEKDLIIQMLEEQKDLIGLSNEDARMVISNFMGRLNRGLKAEGGRAGFSGGSSLEKEYYGKQKLDWMKNYPDLSWEDYLRYKSSGSFADGGRIGGGIIAGKDLGDRTGFEDPNLIRRTKAIKNLNNKWTTDRVTEAAEILYPDLDITEILSDNVKRRKIDTHLTKYGKALSSFDARSEGWKKRPRVEVTDEVINEVRENLIKNKKKVTMVNNQFIFANDKLQQEFLDDLLLRYQYPKTSAAATAAGVKSNKQIFEKYFKGTYSEKGVHDLIDRFKKTLGETFEKLPADQKDAHKLKRQAKELISQAGKRLSGLDDFPSHHLFPIGDEFAHGTQDFTIIDKKMNSDLSGSNKKLIPLTEQRTQLVNDVSTGKITPKDFDIEMGKLDTKAQNIIDDHYKKFPNHNGLLNWRKATSMIDDQGRFMDITSPGKIGGDSAKWKITDINKQIGDLSKEELSTFRGDLKTKATSLLKKAKPVIKGVVKGALKQIPVVGTAWGVSDAAETTKRGLTEPDELVVGYHAGPDLAQWWSDYKAKQKDKPPTWASSSLINPLKKSPPDDGQEVVSEEVKETETKPLFGKYANQIKDIKIP